MKKSLLLILSLSLTTLFSACGGGSSNSDTVDCSTDPTLEGCAAVTLTQCVDADDCDGDGVIDECDEAPEDSANATLVAGCSVGCTDTDDDTVCDNSGGVIDNCPSAANADQANTDNDEFGDACDNDIDNDGILDDGDGSGSSSDAYCTGGNTSSCDDNCKYVSNADQANADSDSSGDDCEDDIDGDGVLDETDTCDTIAASASYEVEGTNTDSWNGCCYDTDGDGTCDINEPSGCLNTVNVNVDAYPDYQDCDTTDTDGDLTFDYLDADRDGDGLKNDADLCPSHADTWYLSRIHKIYYGVGDATSCPSNYFMHYTINGESTSFCDNDYGAMERERAIVSEVKNSVCTETLCPEFTDFNYQNTDWADIEDRSGANNYSAYTGECEEVINEYAGYGDISIYDSIICGTWQADSDRDGKGDACDSKNFGKNDQEYNFEDMAPWTTK